MTTLNTDKVTSFVNKQWDESIIPLLCDYIKIPSQSPDYDPEWETNGLQEEVVDLMMDWVKKQNVPGLKYEIVKLPHRTPLIFCEIESNAKDKENAPTIVLYAHYDKQPPLEGWSEGLGPYKPVIKEGPYAGKWLYGRAGADDGYGLPASLTALRALHEQGVEHGRVVVMIEGCEESGSKDLPFYMDHLKDRIGTPDLLVCLDSGAGNYDTMWMTTSLRGVMAFPMTVSLLKDGVHSGGGSGIAADSFRVVRQLLDRLEDSSTGIMIDEFQVDIPQERIEQTSATAKVLGETSHTQLPFRSGVKPVTNDLTELLLNNTWRPTLTITGADGLPAVKNAGNVLRSSTTVKLSIRLPPSLDSTAAEKKVRELLTTNVPYGAQVTLPEHFHIANGWAAKPLKKWTSQAYEQAAQAFFGQSAQYMGEGGTIPFLGLLQKKFPQTQMCVTGLLGPASNAHGVDEGFPIEYSKKLTACISFILAEHFRNCRE
eukprot:CAMPEP_0117446388 /NCGR_PEP_ID=MMETSP0759-20121206/6313_1 /TAXON_ID=63605 /ORGANISM="Percolomonas cosmopolitus, Strain WS" /LENGTH=484 /DNA_ID=CAMNT_0005238649 /DNA_START=24 /DNA_END=1478 /DNA_ORIENTATION=+